MRTTRITITTVVRPARADINAELQYLAGSLGLFNQRDKDRSKFRIFIALLKAPKPAGLSSDDLASQLSLTRATVIHHIGSLAQAGIVDYVAGRYVLRVATLEQLVARIRADVARTLEELEDVAKACDRELGL
jgi:predicted transcriptional regulator